ncbi:hypothetical protein ACH437_23640 [Streptomyces xinghaiensis]|uniref:hypothetical protein n=1 Tax=Streptomyces xinghaiensis TaxID=1038928 RepID=UPI0037A07765
MAGSCCGRAYRIDAPVDPAPCNALTRTTGGLLVPHTVLQGIAPGGAVSAERSVDVDVTPPAAGACPETWQVGARLTPVSGQASGAVALDAAAANTWVPVTGAEVVLPEAGVYEVVADVQGSIGWGVGVTNAIIDARIFDVTASVPVPMTTRRVILFTDSAAEGTNGIQANASAGALYQVAGPATIRVEGSWRTDSGTTSQKVVWAHNLRFRKVSD